jgi:hypothetical protein
MGAGLRGYGPGGSNTKSAKSEGAPGAWLNSQHSSHSLVARSSLVERPRRLSQTLAKSSEPRLCRLCARANEHVGVPVGQVFVHDF